MRVYEAYGREGLLYRVGPAWSTLLTGPTASEGGVLVFTVWPVCTWKHLKRGTFRPLSVFDRQRLCIVFAGVEHII